MHEDFAIYHRPFSCRELTIGRVPALAPNRSVMPVDERREWSVGVPPAHQQWLYTATVRGREAGQLQLIDLRDTAGFAFIADVYVQRAYRGHGVGEALHCAVLRDFGTLAVEDFCSRDEQALLCRMARDYAVAERSDVEPLGIQRHCAVVTRMFTLTAHGTIEARIA